MDAVPPLALRWLHLVSPIFPAGTVVFDLTVGAIGGILISAIYNFLSKFALPSDYFAWFGIKGLPAMHVPAAANFSPGPARSLTAVGTSGAIIVAISGSLRWITLT